MRVYTLGVFFLSFGALPVAYAQNLAPVAVLDVADDEVGVGVPVSLDAGRSFDPDDAPSMLTFAWDFDDGELGSGANVNHVFSEPGAYRVRVTVSDGVAQAEAGATVAVLLPPTVGRARWSSSIAADETGVFVLAPVAGAVVEVDPSTMSTRRSFELCDEPTSIALSPGGEEVWLVCADASVLFRIDRASGTMSEGPSFGHAPQGLVVCDGGHGLVASMGEVAILGPDAEVQARIAIEGDLRAVACDAAGEHAYVARFLTLWPRVNASIGELDLAEGTLVRELGLSEDMSPDTASSGGGTPNLLASLAIDPSGQTLWVGGLKSNTGRGTASTGARLTPENRVRGLLAPIDLVEAADRIEQRIDTNDAGEVSAITFSHGGRYAYLAHSGIGAISIYDVVLAARFGLGDPGATVPAVSRIEVGETSDGLWLDEDGDRLFVRIRETLELVVLDVSDANNPSEETRVSLAEDPRAADIARGAILFHSSRPPIHSRGGYVACASCHPNGGHDGRTWDFTQFGEGLRNTIDLRGRAGLGHGPLHWSANFDEVQDFENDIVGGFGGDGLAQDGAPPHAPLGLEANSGRSADLDALSAYVTSLDRASESPHRDDAASIARGRSLFHSDEVGCAGCHVPPRFTDSTLEEEEFVLHDVGTLETSSGARLGQPLTGLDTPTVLGVWASPPYLHDGRAATLRDVLTTFNAEDRHGRTSHLDEAELEDLVAYLLSLDQRDAELVESGCGCRVVRSHTKPGAPLALLALCVALALRRPADRFRRTSRSRRAAEPPRSSRRSRLASRASGSSRDKESGPCKSLQG